MLIKCFSPYEIATKSADKAEKKIATNSVNKAKCQIFTLRPSPFACLHPCRCAFALLREAGKHLKASESVIKHLKLVKLVKRLKVSLSILSW